MSDEDYDEIEYLIDNDSIALGARCRAAERKVVELETALRVEELEVARLRAHWEKIN